MTIKLIADIKHNGNVFVSGEILGPDTIDENSAKRLISIYAAQQTNEIAAAPAPATNTPVDFKTLTNAKMFEKLAEMGVDTKGNENKAQLIAFYEKAIAGSENGGDDDDTPLTAEDLEEMPVDEILGELSVLGIPVKGDEDKEQLIALYLEATAAE